MTNKLAIGTVQFGMPYGISNAHGQTKNREVSDILRCANAAGINVLDTAAVYGNSEEVLGQVIGADSTLKFQIVTKTPHFKASAITANEVELLECSFAVSLNKLGVENFYGLLIHACEDLFADDGVKLYRSLERLKAQGKIQKIGVSIYSTQQIDRVIRDYSFDLVQLPVNIIDQRLIENGRLHKLKKRGVEIHARSAFLQGLLLMPVDQVNPWFAPILETIKLFHVKAKEMRISSLALALGFVQGIPEIDRVVVGVNTLDQMKEIVDAADAVITPANFAELSVQDPKFLNPGNWQI